MKNRSSYYNKYIVYGVLGANLITITLYYINMVVLVKSTLFSMGLIMPFVVGSVSGYLLGYFYYQRSKKQKVLLATIEQQRILKEISLLSHQKSSINEVLKGALSLIINASFAKLNSQGGIFLNDSTNTLKLVSHINLPSVLLEKCGVKGVQHGECLCGLAAKEKKTIFKSCVDKQHSITFDGMADHGHYNVPILYKNKVLGVIVVYLNHNHKSNPVEIDFLEAAANILAIIIRKYASEKKAQTKELALNEIQHFAGVATWAKNITTGEITASKELYEMLGYQPSEVLFSESFFKSITHPSDSKKLDEAVELSKKGLPYEIELRHFTKEGSIINIINKCIPKVLKNGFVSEISGIVVNVSKLKENEAELLEKQHLVDGILATTPDPLYLLDVETGEFIYCNNAMDKVLLNNPSFLANYSKIGMAYFRELCHPDDLPRFDAMNTALRNGKKQYALKFRTKVFGNTYRWIEQKVLVYKTNTKGYVKQVLIVSKDIEIQTHAENRIKKLNIELANQNKAVKKINAELDQFVYSVSHDLRAPLSSMLGLVNLSKLNATPTELVDYMDKIGISVKKLDGFIKDILDYSRNARTEIEAKPMVLEQVFMDIINSIKAINNPDIELDFNANETVTYVGDKRRIAIVLNNLISNAVKYADYSKPNRFLKIRIKTSAEGCTFTLEDNGIGIKKEYLGKVYGMFYRATEKSKGSGLGLYIVKEILNKLNGTIEIDSEEGVGTKILLQIPHSQRPTTAIDKK